MVEKNDVEILDQMILELELEWRKFMDLVVVREATSAQRAEMRMAFVAGSIVGTHRPELKEACKFNASEYTEKHAEQIVDEMGAL
jgi:hypothetical protein